MPSDESQVHPDTESHDDAAETEDSLSAPRLLSVVPADIAQILADMDEER
jgi:hypothetical protein